MRMFLTALLCAGAATPLFAAEDASFPDPGDAGAPVPAVTVPEGTGAYKPFQDKQVGSWSELNRAVAPPAKRPGAAETNHGRMSARKAGANANGASVGTRGKMKHEGMHE